jgi:hypothetical protein
MDIISRAKAKEQGLKRHRSDRGVVDGCKICSSCLFDKPVALFNKQTSSKSGLKSRCRDCQKTDSKTYMSKADNAEKSRLWRASNKERLKIYNKAWRNAPENRERHLVKLKIIANAKYRVLTNNDYSESFSMLFKDGMSFDNYGEWQIDHVVPVTLWLDKGITDVNIINDISNLQPLWAKDNLSKGAKYNETN